MGDPPDLNTKDVELSGELLELTERLARHAHAVWMRQRLAEGWCLGPRRDDAARTSPNLVPYDVLPEEEKVYDRTLALETLRAVIALGWRIEKART